MPSKQTSKTSSEEQDISSPTTPSSATSIASPTSPKPPKLRNADKITFKIPKNPQDEDEFFSTIREGVKVSYEDNFIMSIRYFSRAIELRPDHFYGYFRRGVDYFNVRQMSRAREDFETALSSKCAKTLDDSNKHVLRGLLFEIEEKLEQALEEYRHAIARNSQNDYAHFSLGFAQCAKSNHSMAIKHYRKAIKFCSYNTCIIYNNMGWSYQCLGDNAKALESYQEAVKQSPTCVKAIFNIGKLHLENAELDKALEQFELMLQIDKTDISPLIEMGEIYYFDKEDTEKALTYLNKAKLLDPSNSNSYLLLAQIEKESYDAARVKSKGAWSSEEETKRKVQHINKAIDILDAGLNKVLLSSDVEDLTKYRYKLLENLERVQKVPEHKRTKMPQYIDYSNRYKTQAKQELYRFLLHANQKLQEDYSFYQYYHEELASNTGYDFCITFADIRIVTCSKK